MFLYFKEVELMETLKEEVAITEMEVITLADTGRKNNVRIVMLQGFQLKPVYRRL